MKESAPTERHERRRHPRVAVDWPLTISLPDGSHEARLRDVSRAGICFFLDRRIPEMTVLELDFRLPGPGPERRVVGSGVVVRCQPLSRHVDHYEVAVFLNDLSDDNRQRLQAFVAAGR